MKRAILTLLLLLLLTSFSRAKDASLPQSRTEVEGVVSRLWSAASFEQLDSLEVALRTGGKLSASGWPLPDLLYQALEAEMDAGDLSGDQLDALAKRTDVWIAKAPASQLARCVKAQQFISRAWRARGVGYANTVSESQWIEYRRWINVASSYLIQNRDLLKDNSCWYLEMLRIAQQTAADESAYRSLLEQAWRHFPTDPTFYLDPINHYTPKWGGSAQAMKKFIDESTATLNAEIADEMYARQYSYAIEEGLLPSIASARYDCHRWMHGYDLLVARFPTDFNYNSGALAAVICQDRTRAKSYFAMITVSPHPEIWARSLGRLDSFEAARTWANSTR